MSDRLPPLTALRAFEAAARHLSFARAAEELNVTPAALSFQIKSLEPLRTNKHYKHLRQLIALENELTSMSALFNSPFVANHPTTLDLRANNIEMVCLFKSVTFLYTIHIDYLIFFSLISIF